MSTSAQGTYSQEPEKKEYSEDTLRRYYGDVTPYGTLRKDEEAAVAPTDPETRAANNDSAASLPVQKQQTTIDRVPSRNAASTTGTMRSSASYGTTLRRSKGGFYTRSPEPEISLNNIGYIDFLPKKKKEGFAASKRYHGFSSCIDEANKFIRQNRNIKLRNCESLYVRLDHNHRVNPESTTSHDRSYVIGLRLWYIYEEGEDSVFVSPSAVEQESDGTRNTDLDNSDNNSSQGVRDFSRLCYKNVMPDCVNSSGNKTIPTRHRGRPAFENLRETLKKLNKSLETQPLPGQLISVETIPINYYHAFREEKEIDPDYGYWCLDYHGKWNFFMIRLFYLEKNPSKTEYEIDFEDFSPGSSEITEKCPGIDSLTERASKWMHDQEGIKAIGTQTVELPFKPKQLDRRRNISTKNSSYETDRISAFLHTTRILRVWYIRLKSVQSDSPFPSPSSQQSSNSEGWLTQRLLRPGIAVRNFLPCQVTSAGCCGVRKPIFATTEDTVTIIKEWISLTDADVICIQTDNVEKWRGEQCRVGKSLATRLYNKKDFSSSVMANSLEYRLTVFRVFIRADHNGVFTEPDTKEHFRSPTPMEPCCCFVGCSIM